MWLVSALSTGNTPVVSPDLPKTYKEGYREILKADACAVNLYQFGKFFYELGFHAKRFDSRGDVANILIHVSNIYDAYVHALCIYTLVDFYYIVLFLRRRSDKDFCS